MAALKRFFCIVFIQPIIICIDQSIVFDSKDLLFICWFSVHVLLKFFNGFVECNTKINDFGCGAHALCEFFCFLVVRKIFDAALAGDGSQSPINPGSQVMIVCFVAHFAYNLVVTS